MFPNRLKCASVIAELQEGTTADVFSLTGNRAFNIKLKIIYYLNLSLDLRNDIQHKKFFYSISDQILEVLINK